MITSETLERTGVANGERSVSAGAGIRSEAAATPVGRSADPEVAQVAKRRKHSAAYKLRILEEIENSPGKTGVILRREGLYSSNLTRWKRWRNNMNKNGKSSPNKQLHNEVAKLKRENEGLKLKLEQAEGIIELQKKTSEMLNLMSKKQDDEN